MLRVAIRPIGQRDNDFHQTLVFLTKESVLSDATVLLAIRQAHEIELGNGMLPKLSVVNSGIKPKFDLLTCSHSFFSFFFSCFLFSLKNIHLHLPDYAILYISRVRALASSHKGPNQVTAGTE